MKDPRFIIVNGSEYLAHEGHTQYWTKDKDAAMEYTKRDVAEALAKLHKGVVAPLQ